MRRGVFAFMWLNCIYELRMHVLDAGTYVHGAALVAPVLALGAPGLVGLGPLDGHRLHQVALYVVVCARGGMYE